MEHRDMVANKIHVISWGVLVLSVMVFLGAYYYYQKIAKHDDLFSGTIAEVTSSINTEESNIRSMSAAGYTLTEERGIMIAMLFSAGVVFLLLLANVFGWYKYGRNHYHLPVFFACVLVIIWIISTMHGVGLWFI